MNRILSVDSRNCTATIQPGITGTAGFKKCYKAGLYTCVKKSLYGLYQDFSIKGQKPYSLTKPPTPTVLIVSIALIKKISKSICIIIDEAKPYCLNQNTYHHYLFIREKTGAGPAKTGLHCGT